MAKENNSIVIEDWLEEYIDYIKSIPSLSLEEEKRLFECYHSGDEDAKRKIIESNLKLIISPAMRYANDSVSLSDLIQVGNVELMKSFYKYDSNDSTRFNKYCIFSIKYEIRKYAYDKLSIVNVPNNFLMKVEKYKEKEEELAYKLNREPSYKEIKDDLKICNEDFNIYQSIKEEPTNIDNISLIPYDKRIYEDIDNSVFCDELFEVLKKVGVPERKINVIKLRNGIGYDKPYTYEEIGKIYNITRELVRLYEKNVMEKIRLYIDQDTFEFKSLNFENKYSKVKSLLSNIDKYSFCDELFEALKKIGVYERNINIIKLINGIGYDKPYTYEEIGNMYNITTMRVKEIEKKVMEKIRLYIDQNNIEFKPSYLKNNYSKVKSLR